MGTTATNLADYVNYSGRIYEPFEPNMIVIRIITLDLNADEAA